MDQRRPRSCRAGAIFCAKFRAIQYFPCAVYLVYQMSTKMHAAFDCGTTGVKYYCANSRSGNVYPNHKHAFSGGPQMPAPCGFADFFANTGLIALVSLVAIVIYFYFVFRKELKSIQVEESLIRELPSPAEAITDRRGFFINAVIFSSQFCC